VFSWLHASRSFPGWSQGSSIFNFPRLVTLMGVVIKARSLHANLEISPTVGVHRLNMTSLNCIFFGCSFGGLYLLHPIFAFNKICWVMFLLKSIYCDKIFMSIQVVLNVCGSNSKFKIHTFLYYSELRWLITSA